MAEQEIIKEAFQEEIEASTIIHTNGQYTNLYVNDYKGTPGLKAGQYITVQKDSEHNGPYTQEKQGKYGPYNMHMCTVRIRDQKASFVTFSDREAKAFEDVAGLGDTIQISKKKYTYTDKRGTERVKEELVFRKVE